MTQLPSSSPIKTDTFVTVKEGRMCVGSQAVFKEEGSKDSFEMNTVITLTNAQASEVAQIIGFFPNEGYTHYLNEEQVLEIELFIRYL